VAKKLVVGSVKLSWHDRNQQWRKSIGFKPDKSGARRVPAEFYFGANDAEAVSGAMAKINEWKTLCANWAEVCGAAEMVWPKMDVTQPFWFDTAKAERPAAAVKTKGSAHVTLAAARDEYIKQHEDRLGLVGSEGIKPSTLLAIRQTLTPALEPLRPTRTTLAMITTIKLQQMIRAHHGGHISPRTAYNYCRIVWQFLRWCDDHPGMKFSLPKGTATLFDRIEKPGVRPQVPAVEEMTKLLQACRGIELLWVLLGLNCGMYEVDISNLHPSEFVQHGGEWCLWWDREKTSHQNKRDGEALRSLHWLFPETLTLIQKYRSKLPDRLFIHADGRPYLEITRTKRRKIIGNTFDTLNRRAGTAISMKQLRKFTASWLTRQADGEKLARQFLGHQPPGMLRHYVQDEFAQLTSALRQYRAWLADQGALPQVGADQHRSKRSPQGIRGAA
jgi:hypothetical protein